MSAAAQGAKLISKANETTEAAELGVYTQQQADPSNIQGGARAEVFPRKFDTRSPKDDLVRMKTQMMDAQGMSPFGEVQATDADFRWLQSKEKAIEAANFDAWFGQNFHKSSLADRQFAQQINPDYYQAREREMTERAKMALRIKLIELRGPQSEEDLQLVYGLNAGLVQLDEGWDRIGMTRDEAGTAGSAASSSKRFQRGLMGLPKLITSSTRRARQQVPLKDNPFKPAAPFSAFYPQAGYMTLDSLKQAQ